jgi:hypothetical protein
MYGKFINKAVVDGRVRNITFVRNDTSVAAVLPHFWDFSGNFIYLFLLFCFALTFLQFLVSFNFLLSFSFSLSFSSLSLLVFSSCLQKWTPVSVCCLMTQQTKLYASHKRERTKKQVQE